MAVKSKKPKTAWKDLTPAYRKRLESAFKSGKFGEGYSSAGRAYAAGASRQVARGQAKTSEAERTRNRQAITKAKAWSNKHSKAPATAYNPPEGSTPAEQAEYARKYLKAVKELEKGWTHQTPANRQEWDEDALAELFKEYKPEDFNGRISDLGR